MPPLSSLKAKTLQQIAILTGSPSAGTKSTLVGSLTSHLQRSDLPNNGVRILSIDMGIRNLAYCVLEAPELTRFSTGDNSQTQKLRVKEWKKLDLIDRLLSAGNIRTSSDEEDSSVKRGKTHVPQQAFTPSVMSKAAYGITRELLAYKPTTILIERQRFRSGGGSTILEWTVRVNMLESMLWASFETQKMIQSAKVRASFPSMHEVSPARVARFWTAGSDAVLRPSHALLEEQAVVAATAADSGPTALKRLTRSVDKKQKIAVVRSWLAGQGGVLVDLRPELQDIADAFTKNTTQTRRKKGVNLDPDIETLTKLDDLADCLLQGAAWMRWHENRREVLDLLATHDYSLTEP